MLDWNHAYTGGNLCTESSYCSYGLGPQSRERLIVLWLRIPAVAKKKKKYNV